MMSRNVLEAMGGTKVRVSGLPWLKPSEERLVGIDSLVANCLCTAHNSALSPLDAEAGRFYRTLEECLTDGFVGYGEHIFSGHDIERWLLKTAAGYGASRNLAVDGQRLPGTFISGVDVAELLQRPDSWKPPIGMYVLNVLGERIQARPEMGLAPLIKEGTTDIAGLITHVQEVRVCLFLDRPSSIRGTPLENAPYRLRQMRFHQSRGKRELRLSWQT